MCGIAGLIGRRPGDFAKRVGPRLAHRGPDDAGVWQDDSACFVHRRLAILDLSPSGHQPMSSPCGRWVLVFNGEIYNHDELRCQLQLQGFSFRGTSDTEVLLAWLIRHGATRLADLRGMFAFALFDRQERSLLVARDPNGIKPLYLWSGSSGELAFASELRALLASDLMPRRLDSQALASFLASGSVPEPLTMAAEIRRLPAGHRALWQHGKLTVAPWCPIPESLRFGSDRSSTVRRERDEDIPSLVRSALQASVTAHMISDVPVGLFLSGGLDSAALLALAPRGLRTFTIGFSSSGAETLDESEPAARIARQFGASHTPLLLGSDQVRDWLPTFLASQDQPSIDGYNTWCVARLAHNQGIKVALSGLGGDELFGGYPSFRQVPRMWRWRRRLGPTASLFSIALRSTPGRQRARRQRLAAWLCQPPTLAAAYHCYRGLFSPWEIDAILRHWGMAPPDRASSPLQDWDPVLDEATDAVAWFEGASYLRNQLLPDSDALSMASGVELRLPLVDAVLQQHLAHLPSHKRLATGKGLLRQAVPELPSWFLARPKQGFRFPFQVWLDDPDAPLALRLPRLPPHLDISPWYRRWALMVLHHWLQEHLAICLPDVAMDRANL